MRKQQASRFLLGLCGGLCLLWGCNLNRPIDIDLPDYEPEVVVECYLQPGNPIFLSLVKSSSYFEVAQLEYEQGATVVISYDDQRDTLQPVYLPVSSSVPELEILMPLVGETLFFYTSLRPVPANYDTEFLLDITTEGGKQISAVTRIPPPVPIDTIEWKFDEEDSLAFMITRFQDDANEQNFYRRTLHRNDLRNTPEQDFQLSDEILNGQQIVIGTGYDYARGDTLIFSLSHITGDYYGFLETREAAIRGNLSPFAQPAVVRSNVQGGTGIFTGFTTDRKMVVVK